MFQGMVFVFTMAALAGPGGAPAPTHLAGGMLSGEVVEVRGESVRIQTQGGSGVAVGDRVRVVIGSGVVRRMNPDGSLWVDLTEGASSVQLLPVRPPPAPGPGKTAAAKAPPPAPRLEEGSVDGAEAAFLSGKELYLKGVQYYRGEEVVQSYETALQWFLQAAEKKYARAFNDIGVMHETGQGVDRSLERAVEWYRRGAAANDSLAHYNLGRVYEEGLGVKKDYSEALKSYRRAARLGDKNARAKLRRRNLRW